MDDDINQRSNQLTNDSDIAGGSATQDNNVKIVFVPECVIQALDSTQHNTNVEGPPSTLSSCHHSKSNDKKLSLLWDSNSFDGCDCSDNAILNSNNSFDVENIVQSLQIQTNNTFSFEVDTDYFKYDLNGRIALPNEDRTLRGASTSITAANIEESTSISFLRQFSQSSGLDREHTTLQSDSAAERFGTPISVKVIKKEIGDNSPLRFSTPDIEVSSTVEPLHKGNYDIILEIPKDFKSSTLKQDKDQRQAIGSTSVIKPLSKQSKLKRTVSKGTQSKRLFECNRDECIETFHSLADRQKHMLSVHDEHVPRPFKCTFEGCTWSFTTSFKLNRHMSSHCKEKPHICTHPGCEKSFKSSYSQRAHTKTHSTLYPDLTCPHCKKSFSAKREYTKHLREVHNKGPEFPCDVCNVKFYSKQALATHRLTHNPKKVSHACDMCQKEFSKQSLLKEHVMYMHTGERPFKCDECEWAFTTLSKLRRHMLTHKEKRYKCFVEDCNEGFHRVSHLASHLKVAHDASSVVKIEEGLSRTLGEPKKLFSCSVKSCRKVFLSQHRLRDHMKLKHSSVKNGILKAPETDDNSKDARVPSEEMEIAAGKPVPSCDDSDLPPSPPAS